ncbi:MAG: MinD/ParA family protein [Deltaproteobacteria bacterium]|nr:MinD/ParA family protein [Deltaproteobacteria bacterium]MCB9489000.1 MinD/ParA family protein [Deltaproteobacteria bacterium]
MRQAEGMMDQAVQLRERARAAHQAQRMGQFPMAGPQAGRPLRTIAVTSGKGGVGKSNVTANLAIALAKQGQRVMILDADLGLANMDVLLGLTPRHTVADILSGEKRLADVIVDGPGGVRILPGGSGLQNLTHLDEDERMHLLAEFEAFEEPVDVMLIDTGAGIGRNVTYFTTAAQQVLIVVTPEPTSITDAYAVMKVLSTQYGENRFLLLPNNVPNEAAGKRIYQDLTRVAERFLNISIDLVGYVPNDRNIPRSVRRQQPVSLAYPDSPASQSFDVLAGHLLTHAKPSGPKGNLQFMWRRVLAGAEGVA